MWWVGSSVLLQASAVKQGGMACLSEPAASQLCVAPLSSVPDESRGFVIAIVGGAAATAPICAAGAKRTGSDDEEA